MDPIAQLTLEEIDDLTSWTLIRTAHHVERQLTTLFADYDLSPVQFGVLAYLATAQSLTQAELARLVLVRPQSLSAVIEGMVGRGLLRRTGERGRGRPNPLTLSEKGSQVLEAAWASASEADEHVFKTLDTTERDHLNRMVHRVLTGVPATDPALST